MSGITGTSSSTYLGSRCSNGHLRYMMPTPPSSVSSSSSSSPSVSDSESEPEQDAHDSNEDEKAKCKARRPLVYRETMFRFPFLESSQLADIVESRMWNIEICLTARQPLVRTPSGMFKLTPVTRLSFGMIPSSDAPYELTRFTCDGSYYKQQLRFATIDELLTALERYLRHLEPV